MKRLGLAFSLLFIVLCVASYHFITKFNNAFRSSGPLQEAKLIDIPSGSGLTHISNFLKEQGAIKDAFVFEWSVRLRGEGRNLKAGEYEFLPGITPERIMNQLISGKVYLHKYTLAEGLTTEEVLNDIQAHEKLEGEITKTPGEGQLLPETYLFAKGYKRQDLINRMVTSQQQLLQQLWDKRPYDLAVNSPQEALILASIIEKETSIPTERKLISAVFTNRLKKRMPLQMDPTIRYALHKDKGKPLNEALTREELKYDSPYNTYLHRELPPTPICNPGKASLEAVFNPGDSKALYFVADGSGGHIFSSSLKEHQQNHKKWRKLRAEKKRAEKVLTTN